MVSKEKLLQHKGSLFEQMIVSNHPQQLPSGEYVIISLPAFRAASPLAFASLFSYNLKTGCSLKEIQSFAIMSSVSFCMAPSNFPPMSSSERQLNKSFITSTFPSWLLQHLHQLQSQGCSCLEVHCMSFLPSHSLSLNLLFEFKERRHH